MTDDQDEDQAPKPIGPDTIIAMRRDPVEFIRQMNLDVRAELGADWQRHVLRHLAGLQSRYALDPVAGVVTGAEAAPETAESNPAQDAGDALNYLMAGVPPVWPKPPNALFMTGRQWLRIQQEIYRNVGCDRAIVTDPASRWFGMEIHIIPDELIYIEPEPDFLDTGWAPILGVVLAPFAALAFLALLQILGVS